MEEEKIKKEAEKNKKSAYSEFDMPTEVHEVYKKDGSIRICNQGKYEFLLDEDYFKTGITTFTLKLPKYLDTSQVKVDLNPQYVRCDVKGKITQLKFDYEIKVEGSSIQRSQTTGYLVIKADMVGVSKKDIKDTKSNYKSLNANIKKDDKAFIQAPNKNDRSDKSSKPFITYKDDKVNGISEVKVSD